ncbi:hypothetical protein EDP2_3745 [Enterobacter cloacae S611]|uniref:Membrane-anchored protein n=1 Tax=Enterobacter cloacae S611 TaxID=1399146 RepID=A0ABN0Q9H0_ENTCL|nr:hypothetical protein EDP2_3745 [Enterobacter cloacae S611]
MARKKPADGRRVNINGTFMTQYLSLPRALTLVAALCFGFSTLAFAEEAAPDPNEAKINQAVENMQRVSVPGPHKVTLGNQAVLNLPEGFTYIPPRQAAEFMRELGNHVDESAFYGLVFNDAISGFVSIEYDDAGYIKDDDAKDWDAAELLSNLQEGTKEGNKMRSEKGIPPIEVVGWVEKPSYDAATHRLIWSAAIRDIGSNVPLKEQGVNYNTYLLGREGYLSLNLVTDRGTVEQEKPLAKNLLNAVTFNDGKKYSDFNASTDKIAEYGLAALIGGLAAKKLGLLAIIGVTLLKFWKLALIALAGAGMGIKKLLFRKKDDKSKIVE